MLFAAAGEGAQLTDDALRRVAYTNGDPTGILRRDRAAIGLWQGTGDVIETHDDWAVQGAIDLDGRPSLASIRNARGDFALIAFDIDGLFLAAGRAGGHRPLFVARPSPDLIVVCTRLAPILTLFPERPPLDLDFLIQGHLVLEVGFPASGTPFRGVSRLPIGEAWVVAPRRPERRSSTFCPLLEPELSASAGHCAAGLREAIIATTLRATRNARRIAVSASGGIDSSALLAALLGLSRAGRLAAETEAVCQEFQAPSPGDDRPYRRSLEQHFGINIHKVMPWEAAPFLRRQLVIDEMPCRASVVAIDIAQARRARDRGVDIILTGVGGDDVLNGELSAFGDLAIRGHLVGASSIFQLREIPYMGPLARVRHGILPSMLPPLVRSSEARTRRHRRRLCERYPWAGPRLRSRIENLVDIRSAPPVLARSTTERYERLLQLPIFGFLSLLRAQEEALGGFVRREPYLDDDFLRFIATLPPLSLMHGDFRRGLLREAMRGLLPEDVRLRETKAYFEPALAQMVAAAGGFRIVEDLVDVRMLADLGLVEPRLFRSHYEEIVRRPLEVGWPRFWAILSVEEFLRHNERGGKAYAA